MGLVLNIIFFIVGLVAWGAISASLLLRYSKELIKPEKTGNTDRLVHKPPDRYQYGQSNRTEVGNPQRPQRYTNATVDSYTQADDFDHGYALRTPTPAAIAVHSRLYPQDHIGPPPEYHNLQMEYHGGPEDMKSTLLDPPYKHPENRHHTATYLMLGGRRSEIIAWPHDVGFRNVIVVDVPERWICGLFWRLCFRRPEYDVVWNSVWSFGTWLQDKAWICGTVCCSPSFAYLAYRNIYHVNGHVIYFLQSALAIATPWTTTACDEWSILAIL